MSAENGYTPEDVYKGDFDSSVLNSNFQRELRTEGNESRDEQRIKKIKEELLNRETPPEYQSLAEGARFIELTAPYAENLVQSFYCGDDRKGLSELGEFVALEIKGQIMLDLGCGRTFDLSQFARQQGAGLYIGVDLNPNVYMPVIEVEEREDRPWLKKSASKLSGIVNDQPEKEDGLDRIPSEPLYRLGEGFEKNTLQVKDDMLKAISRIKSGSVKLIVISGIEVSSENAGATDQYLYSLKKEMKRVLVEDGIVINNQSDISVQEMDRVEVSGQREGMTISRNKRTEA